MVIWPNEGPCMVVWCFRKLSGFTNPKVVTKYLCVTMFQITLAVSAVDRPMYFDHRRRPFSTFCFFTQRNESSLGCFYEGTVCQHRSVCIPRKMLGKSNCIEYLFNPFAARVDNRNTCMLAPFKCNRKGL